MDTIMIFKSKGIFLEGVGGKLHMIHLMYRTAKSRDPGTYIAL